MMREGGRRAPVPSPTAEAIVFFKWRECVCVFCNSVHLSLGFGLGYEAACFC